jgi:hypothetical protein
VTVPVTPPGAGPGSFDHRAQRRVQAGFFLFLVFEGNVIREHGPHVFVNMGGVSGGFERPHRKLTQGYGWHHEGWYEFFLYERLRLHGRKGFLKF